MSTVPNICHDAGHGEFLAEGLICSGCGTKPPAIDCPDWCTIDHTGDDPADPIENLILHMGDDHGIDETTRDLLHAHEGSQLDVRVARTDCPQEGTVGVPALMVRADLELTTWEQAAELARAILDSFGYLKGADQA
ncbi:hypothetical protein AB0M02_44300 [Actinoplanes sp. NPDC051861]|uniref:DUF6907 domain-containing protein n=1 Tax=Actinoplanes sp. NPDC051861 TaxID=3155170 RepID=UPI0034314AD7